MARDPVLKAASGVAVIVHAVNPPGYRNWAKLVLPMLDNTMAATSSWWVPCRKQRRSGVNRAWEGSRRFPQPARGMPRPA